jgi:hypothetical protein
MRLRAIALLVLLQGSVLPQGPALAADAPEAVYAKVHRAAMAGDLVELVKYSPAKRRAEVQAMSAASKDAYIKMAQHLLPRGYQVHRTTVLVDGHGILLVSGPWFGEGEKSMTMYGVVRLVLEDGEWKFEESNWSTQKPPELAGPKPAAATAAVKPPPGAGQKVAPSAYTETPMRRLGEAKPECLYKPVMTARDLENCK